MKREVHMLPFVLIALLCGVTGIACSGKKDSGTTGTASAEKQPFVLKYNCVKSATDPDFIMWNQAWDKAEELSKGTLKIERYSSEALGKTVDMLEAASLGNPVIQDCDASHLGTLIPDFTILMHPYLITEPGQIEYLWKSEWGQKISKELEAKGLHLISLVYFGTRHLISNKEVRTRADTKNMLIRCAATKMWNQVALTLGGNPTNTAWSEVYQALSQGVADGAESPVSLLYSAKLYEVRKHISLTGHLVATTAQVMSQSVYESLPAEAKAALDNVGFAQCNIAIDYVQSQEAEWRQKLESEGVKFNEVDKTDFIAAAADVSKAFPEWTPGLYGTIRDILKNYKPR
jgi:TRAP-type C4-dicarboxylate transport system substrate-binding protein